jgi:HAD superfamily hydrolase (TIGR01509 family)
MDTGLLFDLDGTLVDTEDTHFEAFREVFGDLGIGLDRPAYTARIMGHPSQAIAASFLPHMPPAEGMKVMAHKEEVYRGRVGGAKPTAGTHALLDYADRRGVKYALVTNAPMANAVAVLDAVGLRKRFTAVVSADDLAHSKPHPLPYLHSLERLGAKAVHSVAFEDARSGARAAVAANIPLVGITSSLDAATLTDLGATIAVRDFADPAVRELLETQLAKR